jgi:PBP1b-binding outer membrane lipoprotein LpoB
MKKLLFAAVISVFLVGCNHMPQVPEASVVTKYKYVVVTVPQDLLTIPSQVSPIDPKTATDKDAAKWMLDSEARYIEIEKRLKSVKAYLDNKLKELQIDLKIPKEDVIVK